MQSIFSYAGYDKKEKHYDFKRAFRETLIYQTINTFEKKYTPDDAIGVTGYARKELTLEQKCRLRNDIMRKATDAVHENERTGNGPTDIYSADVIEDAFFATDYGKQFANQREQFNTQDRDANRQVVSGWTTGQGDTDRFRVSVSPYDPMFANADGLSNDEIGYIIGSPKGRIDANGDLVRTSGISRSADIGSGAMLSMDTDAVTGRPKDIMIRGTYSGSNGLLEPCTDELMSSKKASGDPTPLYGPSELSGYNLMSHYIKTKAAKRDVHDLLTRSMDGGRAMSQSERDFIEKSCRYFSENGIDFDISANTQDGTVTANLGSRRQVRLYDRDHPRYQGRIYDNGTVAYVSVPTRGATTDSNYQSTYQTLLNTITADDRLNAIDYYLGGSPKIANDGISGYRDVPIGSNIKIKGGRDSKLYASDSSNSYIATAKISEKVCASNVNIAIHPVNVPGADAVAVNLRIEPASSPYSAILPDMSDAAFAENRNDLVTRLSDDLLYTEDMYPSDRVYDSVTNDYSLRPDIPADHYAYYRQAAARNTLDDWVTNAKENHASLVNIDDIIEKYETYGADGYEYPYDGDERIAEIQKLYWDVLDGKKSTGKTKKTHDAGIDGIDEEDIDAAVELDAFDSDVFTADMDTKKQAIRDHYAHYSETAFGRVPELIKPAAFQADNNAIRDRNNGAGFNPTMVARYASLSESHSVQRNYDYIRHVLTQLGDAYDDTFVKDNTYIGDEIKKDMIKYDPTTAACKYYSSKMNRYTGIPFGAICPDGDISQVNFDKLYDYAPSLENKPVTTDMLLHTASVLHRSGCDLNSIEVNVDDNGIISYRAAQRQNNSTEKGTGAVDFDPRATYPMRGDRYASKSSFTMLQGQIGQVFEPDENGAIIPRYASTKPSKVIVPGYDAYLVNNDPDDPKPMRDRLRLSDWQHQMKQRISGEIHRAAFGDAAQYAFIPHTTSLNSVYRHTYDMEMTELEYREKLDENLFSEAEVNTFKNILSTLTKRCRFPNEYGEGSTTTAQSYLEHPTQDEAVRFDYYYSDLCDNTNLRTLGPQFDGIFDPNVTGTAKNQGLVRYLADGVNVDTSTGKVTPIEEFDPKDPPRCALMKDDLFALADHDSWDRRQMPTTMAITALRTPRNVGAAMMTLGGDTFDDGFTVSSDFADHNQVRGENGTLRSLIPQDKLADLHGNKGVISRIVRRDQWSGEMVNHVDVTDISDAAHSTATYEGNTYTFHLNEHAIVENDPDNPREDQIRMQATKAIQKQLNIDDEKCKVFYDNPNLDVVMSPYSGMSRFNGGTVRELMNNPGDLIVNGQTVDGGMGHMNFIVVNMLADKKTHWYDEDAVSEGKGRKASGQLLWQLEAKGADKIINEFYGSNTPAWDSFREYAIVTGLDLSTDLTPVVGYQEQEHRGEHRRLFTMPDDDLISSVSITKDGAAHKLKLKNCMEESHIQADMNKMGGFMELPFQLDFKTLDHTNNVSEAMKRAINDKIGNPFLTQPTGNTYTVGGETHKTYGVPVLPPSLRSGQDFKDGTARNHDYTTWYLEIYKQGITYRALQNAIADPATDESKRALCSGMLDQVQAKAQENFDKIVNDVVDKQFNTKHNVVRDNVFTARIPSSATAVVSADAALKSDEIAMSHEHAVQLGIMDYDADKDEYYWSNRRVDANGNVTNPGNGQALIWRDPLLREGGVRYMSVRIDDSVTGIKMNPAMGKSFDGDFDGDSYAALGLKTAQAQKQAKALFHVSTNMLDLGAGKDKNGMYPLFINSGMDMTAKMYEDARAGGNLKERFDDITRKANAVQAAIESGTVDRFTYEARVPMTRTNSSTGRKVMVRDSEGELVYQKNSDGSYATQTLTGKEAISACRAETKRELDEFLRDSFSGIAVDHIVVKDAKSVVQSVQHIVDSGAKGNQGKMREFMDNVGIDYELGDDGRADLSTVHEITMQVDGKDVVVPKIVKEGIEHDDDRARRHDNAIQETAAYKADNTALGGTSSQNGVCAFRNYNLHEILELTYPTTQAILQSKHDPKDAKVKDEIVRFWGHDVWNGYELTGNWSTTDPDELQNTAHERKKALVLDADGQPIPVMDYKGRDENGDPIREQRQDANGKPVYETMYRKCTKEQWVNQMKGMMCALKVDVNSDYIKTLADTMYDESPKPMISAETGRQIYANGQPLMYATGCVVGVTEFADKHGALLDKVAYTGRMTALKDAALSNYEPYVNMMADDRNVTITPSGSLVGNAVEKGAEAYALEFQAKQTPSTVERKELFEQARQIRSGICASGMPVPNSIVSEAAGDAYRAEAGESQNPVYKNHKYAEVDPVPLGRKDCRLSKKDWESAAYRVMGETTAEYEARVAAASVQETPVSVTEPEISTAVETVAENASVEPAVRSNDAIKINVVDYSNGAQTQAVSSPSAKPVQPVSSPQPVHAVAVQAQSDEKSHTDNQPDYTNDDDQFGGF